MTARGEVRYMLESPDWARYVSPDRGRAALIEAEVGAPCEGRETVLYQWHPDSCMLTNETYQGRVGRFFDRGDAERFLVERLFGKILSIVEEEMA